MSKPQEKLAESLQVLKDYQDTHNAIVIKGKSMLGATHTNRLVANGFLDMIIKGWYLATKPGHEGDTSVWYASYWDFVAAYCNSRFGRAWSLTPEQSLAIYSGDYMAPMQLIVRSPKGSNNIIAMKHGTTLLDLSASLPRTVYEEKRYGLHLFPLSEALLFASPGYFLADKMNARTCLASIETAAEVLQVVAEEGNSARAGRIIGALQNIGRKEMADEIYRFMKRLGYDVRIDDPFADKMEIPYSPSPYSTRMALMWKSMREQVRVVGKGLATRHDRNLEETIALMERNYVHDAYHSLSIEGYRVTEGLIEKVRSGKWNPKDDPQDAERRGALAARGYYQAFLAVKESVRKIFSGGQPGEVFASDHASWHFELFEPCVQAGIISPADLAGYRTSQVYIRGSRHIPFNADAVRTAMITLCDLLCQEDDGFVRAVLGHFFLVFIHPYMDGNGRTARFLMNLMLATAGLPWVIIPVERRKDYMKALETASADGDIRPFADFVGELVDKTAARLAECQ